MNYTSIIQNLDKAIEDEKDNQLQYVEEDRDLFLLRTLAAAKAAIVKLMPPSQ